MENITVLLLSGGDSIRLWPLYNKHFISFFSKPLIYHCLKQLQKQGFRRIIIVVNKNNIRLFKRVVKNFSKMKIEIVTQTDKKGMAGAVYSAKKNIKGRKLLIISPSDVLEESIFENFKKLIRSDPDGVIAGVERNEYFPGGYLTVKSGKVIGIVEKPGPSKRPSNIITFVFHYFKKPDMLINAISKLNSKKDNVYELSIKKIINQYEKFEYLPYKGFWGYLKYPWHVLNLSSYYLSKIQRNKIKGEISKRVEIGSQVVIEEGVRILEGAKIVGPSFIGKGTIVGNNSIIRESMIGRNCVIGFSSEVARSFIGDNCWFHSNYVGDSVLDDDVSMGAGAILANFRLDESIILSKVKNKMLSTGKIKFGSIIGKHVRIGVNASIMPGIKVGRNSFVGAGVLLNRDLEEDKFCSISTLSYVVKSNKTKYSYEKRKKIINSIKL